MSRIKRYKNHCCLAKWNINSTNTIKKYFKILSILLYTNGWNGVIKR